MTKLGQDKIAKLFEESGGTIPFVGNSVKWNNSIFRVKVKGQKGVLSQLPVKNTLFKEYLLMTIWFNLDVFPFQNSPALSSSPDTASTPIPAGAAGNIHNHIRGYPVFLRTWAQVQYIT